MKETTASKPIGFEVEEQIKLTSHKWHISCLSFSVNGVYFASGSWDKQVKIWDLRVLTDSTQVGNQSNGHDAPVTALSWFPNVEFLLVSGSADNSVRIWNSESGERISVLQGHTGWVLGTSFNSSGTVLATASWDKTVGIWDINTLKLSQSVHGHTSGVWKCCFSPLEGSNLLSSAGEDSSLKLWDLRTDTKWHPVANLVGVHDDGLRCCSWSPCGNFLAAGSSDTKISVWDVREHKVLSVLEGHSDMVTDVRFLNSGTSQVLASVGDTTCRFWSPFASRKSRQLDAVKQHDLDYEVECLDISPDGTLLATGGRDNNIVLSTVSINEAELQKWSISDPHVKVTKQQSIGNEGISLLAKRSSIKASTKSSALLVDDTVQKNDYLESEKARQIAKQTVKLKPSGTSEVLQNKLQELKGNKAHEEKPEAFVVPSVTTESSNKSTTLIDLPERDYGISAPHETVNSNSLYENGLILDSVKTSQTKLVSNASKKERQVSTKSTTESMTAEIEDVANELIRISEEQQSYDERF